MTRRTYSVTGMSCDHCAGFVSDEVEEVAGVTAVTVDVDGGTITVTSDEPLDTATVRAAVEEAGYELTGAVG